MHPTGRWLAPRGLLLAAILAAAGPAVAPTPAQAQEFDPGRHIPGVRLAVGFDPYEVTGSTAAQIMRQLQTVTGGRPSWVRFPALFTWNYDAEVIPMVRGTPSNQCRFAEFGLTLDFTAVYPRWTAVADAAPELVEAWAAFQRQIERQWQRERDENLVRAAEVVRRARSYEDHCPIIVQRFHDVVREVMDWSRPLEGHEAPEPVAMRWPPTGYEGLLRPNVTDTTDEAPEPAGEAPEATDARAEPAEADENTGARPDRDRGPVVEVRPGRPSPARRPAPDLESALRTDLMGTSPTGFVVGLHHQGAIEYLSAFGVHPVTGDSLTIDTAFPVPAFTEVLVSTLTRALDAGGVLDLDAPVSRYLEGLSPGLGDVTLSQLLEHRAGLDNAPPRDSTMAWDRVLDGLDDRALMTEPGMVPSYSSYSFGLAVRVLERIAGTPLEDTLQRTLLDPLGMESTFLGARDADGVVAGLPVTYTSAADLLGFWLAWLDGSITGVDFDLLPGSPTRTLAPEGRAFRGGLWIDRPGAVPRLSLVCSTGPASTRIEVFPATRTVLMVIGLEGWPRHTGTFMLDAVGRTLRIGAEVFGPVRLAGVAGFARRERPCGSITTGDVHVPVDFGPRAEAAQWAGRYINGDWFFALEEDEQGLLVSPRPQDVPWDIHHFEGETYFASVPPEHGRGVGFPFRLFVGPDGRRYLMLRDRAYVHEDDRPSRRPAGQPRRQAQMPAPP